MLGGSSTGAWRSTFYLYSCKWPLIPGLKTGGFSAFITKQVIIEIELEKYLAEGWSYVDKIGVGKVIVKLPH